MPYIDVQQQQARRNALENGTNTFLGQLLAPTGDALVKGFEQGQKMRAAALESGNKGAISLYEKGMVPATQADKDNQYLSPETMVGAPNPAAKALFEGPAYGGGTQTWTNGPPSEKDALGRQIQEQQLIKSTYENTPEARASKQAAQTTRAATGQENAAQSTAKEIIDDKHVTQYTANIDQGVKEKGVLLNPDSPLTPQSMDEVLRGQAKMVANAPQSNESSEAKARIDAAQEWWARNSQKYLGKNVDLRDTEMAGLLSDVDSSIDNLNKTNSSLTYSSALRKANSIKPAHEKNPLAINALNEAVNQHKNYYDFVSQQPDQPIYIKSGLSLKKISDYAKQNKMPYSKAANFLYMRLQNMQTQSATSNPVDVSKKTKGTR